jgi:2-oxoglutarate dehydrogenase E1 component
MRAEGRATTGRVAFAGRDPSASPSTGYGEVHAQEQAKLLENALDMGYQMPSHM